MKKLFLSLSILGLAGSLYAGGACCSVKKADKAVEKTEKKADCTTCDKSEDKKCKSCAAKAKTGTEKKTDAKS